MKYSQIFPTQKQQSQCSFHGVQRCKLGYKRLYSTSSYQIDIIDNTNIETLFTYRNQVYLMRKSLKAGQLQQVQHQQQHGVSSSHEFGDDGYWFKEKKQIFQLQQNMEATSFMLVGNSFSFYQPEKQRTQKTSSCCKHADIGWMNMVSCCSHVPQNQKPSTSPFCFMKLCCRKCGQTSFTIHQMPQQLKINIVDFNDSTTASKESKTQTQSLKLYKKRISSQLNAFQQKNKQAVEVQKCYVIRSLLWEGARNNIVNTGGFSGLLLVGRMKMVKKKVVQKFNNNLSGGSTIVKTKFNNEHLSISTKKSQKQQIQRFILKMQKNQLNDEVEINKKFLSFSKRLQPQISFKQKEDHGKCRNIFNKNSHLNNNSHVSNKWLHYSSSSSRQSNFPNTTKPYCQRVKTEPRQGYSAEQGAWCLRKYQQRNINIQNPKQSIRSCATGTFRNPPSPRQQNFFQQEQPQNLFNKNNSEPQFLYFKSTVKTDILKEHSSHHFDRHFSSSGNILSSLNHNNHQKDIKTITKRYKSQRKFKKTAQNLFSAAAATMNSTLLSQQQQKIKHKKLKFKNQQQQRQLNLLNYDKNNFAQTCPQHQTQIGPASSFACRKTRQDSSTLATSFPSKFTTDDHINNFYQCSKKVKKIPQQSTGQKFQFSAKTGFLTQKQIWLNLEPNNQGFQRNKTMKQHKNEQSHRITTTSSRHQKDSFNSIYHNSFLRTQIINGSASTIKRKGKNKIIKSKYSNPHLYNLNKYKDERNRVQTNRLFCQWDVIQRTKKEALSIYSTNNTNNSSNANDNVTLQQSLINQGLVLKNSSLNANKQQHEQKPMQVSQTNLKQCQKKQQLKQEQKQQLKQKERLKQKKGNKILQKQKQQIVQLKNVENHNNQHQMLQSKQNIEKKINKINAKQSLKSSLTSFKQFKQLKSSKPSKPSELEQIPTPTHTILTVNDNNYNNNSSKNLNNQKKKQQQSDNDQFVEDIKFVVANQNKQNNGNTLVQKNKNMKKTQQNASTTLTKAKAVTFDTKKKTKKMTQKNNHIENDSNKPYYQHQNCHSQPSSQQRQRVQLSSSTSSQTTKSPSMPCSTSLNRNISLPSSTTANRSTTVSTSKYTKQQLDKIGSTIHRLSDIQKFISNIINPIGSIPNMLIEVCQKLNMKSGVPFYFVYRVFFMFRKYFKLLLNKEIGFKINHNKLEDTIESRQFAQKYQQHFQWILQYDEDNLAIEDVLHEMIQTINDSNGKVAEVFKDRCKNYQTLASIENIIGDLCKQALCKNTKTFKKLFTKISESDYIDPGNLQGLLNYGTVLINCKILNNFIPIKSTDFLRLFAEIKQMKYYSMSSKAFKWNLEVDGERAKIEKQLQVIFKQLSKTDKQMSQSYSVNKK